jgi:phosphoglycolate phosphatase-like HAD superfamily hydrolase
MKVCLFDIDGTLLSSGGAGKAAMEAALASAFAVPADAGDIPFSGRTDRAITRDLLARHQVEYSPKNWRRFVMEYLAHLPGFLQRKPGRIMPGIVELLDQLGQLEDLVIGILTGNVRDGARLKLSSYGLVDHFRCGGYGDQHHERDEVAKEAMLNVQRHVGGPVDRDDVWVIGDTPLDVQCARHIGVHAAAIATGWHSIDELAESKPDLLLSDLADATPLLERMGVALRTA